MTRATLPFEKTRDPGVSRRVFTALSLGVGVSSATPGLAAATVVEREVTVETADGRCDAALFHPQGEGAWPGVVMFSDALGLRPAFREMGRRLAAQGYTVLVPNPFYRTRKAPVLSGPFDFSKPEDRAKLTELMAPLSTEAKTRDIAAYVTHLDAARQVSRKVKLGVVGYCMGGPYVILAAASASQRVGAGASFHGGGLVTDKPDSPHLLISKVKGRYYFGIADGDDQKQPDAKLKLRDAFAAAGTPAEIEVYTGCQHGWCVSDGAVYNRIEADRAFGKLQALYAETLV